MFQPVGLIALVIAMIVTLHEMASALRPDSCPECRHCLALAEDDARTQERLSSEYARSIGIDDEDDGRRID